MKKVLLVGAAVLALVGVPLLASASSINVIAQYSQALDPVTFAGLGTPVVPPVGSLIEVDVRMQLNGTVPNEDFWTVFFNLNPSAAGVLTPVNLGTGFWM